MRSPLELAERSAGRRERRRSKRSKRKRHTKNSEARRKQRKRILKRDNYECLRCGAKEVDEYNKPTGVKLTLDRIRAGADGGKYKDENLQTLCKDCNEAKGSRCVSYLPPA